ncbi:hypothetical protein [Rickettsiella endosymbiont of Aleochara curtula]|uniref:hypothetical protein n=1 Tax=Rickettsiella endosymbiont of Aleochara curtula TaxID=3077936 RepID=UPI00313B424C
MKELVLNTKTNSLFNVIESALQIKKEVETTSKSSWLATIITPSLIKNLQTIVRDKPNLKLNNFAVFLQGLEDTLQAEINLKQKENYQESTDRVHQVYWKILQLLTGKNLKQRAEVLKNTLVYLKYFEFLGENNFSNIKVASIIYSLAHSEPLHAADMLVLLNRYQLLNEESLGKITANRNLNIKLFTRVIEKLSLSGGTTPLLNQANLDKLLDNPELNLKMLAYFIQVDAESKILTQKIFGFVISNLSLLTETEIDSTQFANVIYLLDKADILTQDNFDIILSLEQIDRANLFSVLSKFSDSNILDQEQFSKFLAVYNKVKVFDNQNRDSKDDLSDSLTDGLCAAFLRIAVLTKNICKIIVEFFMNKIKLHTEKQAEVKTDLGIETQNCNSFFVSACSKSKVTDPGALRANISNTCGVK